MPLHGRFLPPGKNRYPLYRRLGGPQGRSGQVRKISPPLGFDPRTVQPVASRYTDCANRPAAGYIDISNSTIVPLRKWSRVIVVLMFTRDVPGSNLCWMGEPDYLTRYILDWLRPERRNFLYRQGKYIYPQHLCQDHHWGQPSPSLKGSVGFSPGSRAALARVRPFIFIQWRE